jgi:probable HAF family extracellular repeat protein
MKRGTTITHEGEKQMQSGKTIFTALVVGLCVSVGTAAAPTLTFTFKDVHSYKAAQETDSYGINNKGVIVGDYVDSTGIQHGMILTGTKVTKADNASCAGTPGSTGISFYAVNSAGVAAGWCTANGGTEIGYTYSKGKFTSVTIPNAVNVNVTGINDKGNLVGAFVNSAGVQHAFLLVGKTLTKLNPPNVTSPVAWGINNSGVVTVYGTNSAGTLVSFTTPDKGKTYKQFQVPGAGTGGAVIHAPNNKGDVVGTYYDTNGVTHGWLFHAGTYYSFDDPTTADTRGDGLNDTRVIVGRYGSGAFGGVGYEATTKGSD